MTPPDQNPPPRTDMSDKSDKEISKEAIEAAGAFYDPSHAPYETRESAQRSLERFIQSAIDQSTSAMRDELERVKAFRPLAVEALNELHEMRKQIIHGGAWTRKIDDLFDRARKAGL